MNTSNEELHRELWRWCAETGARKEDWPGWNVCHDVYRNTCFACIEAIRRQTPNTNMCDHCPVEWSTTPNRCDGSAFEEWNILLGTNKTMERKRLASIIAELPWRKI